LPGTVAASKAVVVDVNKDISSFRNLTATGDITFGGLSDGTITVTDILDEDDLTSNSATSLATQQSIKAYVDSQVGSFDTLAEILSNGNTTGGTNISVSTGDDIKFADGSQAIFGASDDLRINHNGSYSYVTDLGEGPLFIGGNEEVSIMNGQLNEYKIKAETNGAVTLYYDNAVKMATTSLGIDVTGTITFDGGETTADLYFGDNDKAIFGAGSDLQIYHDGSASYIEDAGQGNLLIKTDGTKIALQDGSGTNMLQARTNGGVELAYLGANKLATSSTGVDISGTLTSDGLTVAQGSGANILLESTTTGATTGDIFGEIEFKTNDSNSAGIKGKIDSYSEGAVGNGALRLFTGDTTGLYQRMNIASNGDISFYEDTGTTPKFFWDASAERLGIGTSSPTSKLHVKGRTIAVDGAAASDSPRLNLDLDGTNKASVFTIGCFN
jgi:hypothetical protein